MQRKKAELLLDPKEALLAFVGDGCGEGYGVAEDKAVGTEKPRAFTGSYAVFDFRCAYDRAAREGFEWRNNDAPLLGDADSVVSAFVEKLSCVNKERATERRLPCAILYIFVALDNEPCPRLADREGWRYVVLAYPIAGKKGDVWVGEFLDYREHGLFRIV